MPADNPAPKTAVDLLQDPPPGVDLTLVGGQALVFWTLTYQTQYPDFFPDHKIGSTYDLDFIVGMPEACDRCYQHWGGKLYKPAKDDPTPELGQLVFNQGDDDQLTVDLLGMLIRLDRKTIQDKYRVPLRPGIPAYDSMFILSQWAVLLNRVYNTVDLPKYQKPEAIIQVHNACAIYKSYIQSLIDSGDLKDAQSKISLLLEFALNSKHGIPLFLKHNVDLLDCLPAQTDQFDANFVRYELNIKKERVIAKRERILKADNERNQARSEGRLRRLIKKGFSTD